MGGGGGLATLTILLDLSLDLDTINPGIRLNQLIWVRVDVPTYVAPLISPEQGLEQWFPTFT